ncbi:MAG: DUF3078 domain-containing protein [Bacteroidales bacterium]|nr:DUF3078 domain-containing protein [Bacteroidales bacterium]
MKHIVAFLLMAFVLLAPHNLLANNPVKPLISPADSLLLREQAQREALFNPLFLDWVFINHNSGNTDTTQSTIWQMRRKVMHDVENTSPDVYRYHYQQLPLYNEIMSHDIRNRSISTLNNDSIVRKSVNEHDRMQQVKAPEASFWSRSMLIQIQGTQNYISPNWYNGGESSLSLLGYVNAQLKYDNKKNIQWENLFEWKEGLNGVKSDSLHHLRVGEDLLKLNTKFGLKAFKNFYYTASLEASTTLFNTYLSNSYERTTAPLSPIRFYGNLGMDYKYKKIVSVMLSPLAYKLVYVNDTTVHPGVSTSVADKVGIPDGQKILHQFGSSLEVKFNYSISREIVLDSKMKFYTNYKGIEWDWEIVGNFIINRFLSARVSLNPRYDSTITTTEKPKIQFKELTSIGFSYKF